MANNVNIGPARVVRAAILHTAENGPLFNATGALAALRDPQLAGLIAAMNPIQADGDGRLSFARGATSEDIIPRVRLNYQQQHSTGSSTATRRVADPATAPVLSAPLELDVDFNLHREYDVRFDTIDLMSLEATADAYLRRAQGQQVSLNAGDVSKLTPVGNKILYSMEADLMTPTNSSALTALIAAVGFNRATGTAAVQNIFLYDSEGKVRKDFWRYINNLKLLHGIKGKPIIIGGKKLVSFMNEQGIASPADIGVDFAKMFAQLSVAWYYDEAIDTLYGADRIIIFDPGAAALETILEHKHIVKEEKVANTYFGTAAINVAQAIQNNFILDLDLRVREYDTTKYPRYVVTPSFKFGVFTRPAGYRKTYDNWTGVTGIFGARLVDVEPTP